jgi:hypothetical protein
MRGRGHDQASARIVHGQGRREDDPLVAEVRHLELQP